MSMEIKEIRNPYKSDYIRQLKAEETEAKETEKKSNDTKAPDKTPALQDEYISSEKSGTKPNGLYHLGQDENGNRKVFFNDPKKAGNADQKNQPEVKADHSGKPAEKCTTNTDKVDREIKNLKQKQQQLEQQIRSASGDEKKTRELEKKLAQVKSELSQKDTDTYRRQHASVSDN